MLWPTDLMDAPIDFRIQDPEAPNHLPILAAGNWAGTRRAAPWLGDNHAYPSNREALIQHSSGE
jgi:hypothetical protein